VALAGILGAPLLAGCAPPAAPERPLPPYTGESTEVFDDQIDPAAVGLTLEPSAPPSTDLKLRQRVQTADATVKVTVRTVTEKHEDRGTSYVLGLRRVEVYGGAFPPPETFQVHVGTQGASHGVVNSFEARLVGHSFIATVRQFAHGESSGASDEHDLHFHFYTADRATAEAVQSAFALESFR
jgi:hypothetical protein